MFAARMSVARARTRRIQEPAFRLSALLFAEALLCRFDTLG